MSNYNKILYKLPSRILRKEVEDSSFSWEIYLIKPTPNMPKPMDKYLLQKFNKHFQAKDIPFPEGTMARGRGNKSYVPKTKYTLPSHA
jgi:hypothetical protein